MKIGSSRNDKMGYSLYSSLYHLLYTCAVTIKLLPYVNKKGYGAFRIIYKFFCKSCISDNFQDPMLFCKSDLFYFTLQWIFTFRVCLQLLKIVPISL